MVCPWAGNLMEIFLKMSNPHPMPCLPHPANNNNNNNNNNNKNNNNNYYYYYIIIIIIITSLIIYSANSKINIRHL